MNVVVSAAGPILVRHDQRARDRRRRRRRRRRRERPLPALLSGGEGREESAHGRPRPRAAGDALQEEGDGRRPEADSVPPVLLQPHLLLQEVKTLRDIGGLMHNAGIFKFRRPPD